MCQLVVIDMKSSPPSYLAFNDRKLVTNSRFSRPLDREELEELRTKPIEFCGGLEGSEQEETVPLTIELLEQLDKERGITRDH